MKDNKQRLFEVMHKVNPDFVVKEAIDLTRQARTPEQQAQRAQFQQRNQAARRAQREAAGIIADGNLSIGELKEAIAIMSKTNTKEKAIALAKKLSDNKPSDVVSLVSSLAGAGMFVAGVTIAAPVAVAGLGILGLALTAREAVGFVTKMFDTKITGSAAQNPLMKAIGINNEVSTLLDKDIEKEFIQYAANLIISMPDTATVPNFFEKLKEFIKSKNYSQNYTIANKYATQAR